jgi:acyl carrier protein
VLKADVLQAETIARWISAWLVRELKLPAQSVDSSRAFADYGLDSVKAVELAQELENWLGESSGPRLDLGATIAWNFPTIDALAHYLAGELAGGSQANHEGPRGLPEEQRLPARAGGHEHEGREGTLRESSSLRAEELESNAVSLDGADFAELLREELEAVKRRRIT